MTEIGNYVETGKEYNISDTKKLDFVMRLLGKHNNGFWLEYRQESGYSMF